MRNMELLAPAGGMEQLKMAVRFDANAVYLAGRHWGMRSARRNFSAEELAEAVGYAHGHGVAVHVTVNVLMHQEDFAKDALPAYLSQCAGVVMDVNPAMLFAYITGMGVLMGLSVAGAKHGDAILIDEVVRREEAAEAE